MRRTYKKLIYFNKPCKRKSDENHHALINPKKGNHYFLNQKSKILRHRVDSSTCTFVLNNPITKDEVVTQNHIFIFFQVNQCIKRENLLLSHIICRTIELLS